MPAPRPRHARVPAGTRSIISLCLLLLASPLAAQHAANVLFTGPVRTTRSDTVRSAAVFFDRDGNIYPQASFPMDSVRLARETYNRLVEYFRPTTREGRWAWNALRAAYPVSLRDTSFNALWVATQDAMADDIALQVRRIAQGRAPLVILIHGFNNTAAEAREVYGDADSLIRGAQPDAPRLEVYWDGLSGQGTKRGDVAAWGGAQHNSYFVGLGLRRILNRLDTALPVRVLTHSSGAIVITNALWNVEAKLDTRSRNPTFLQEIAQYRRNRDDSTRFPTPISSDLRIAMIAPAMPGLTFADFATRTPASHSTVSPSRVIVGLNDRDEVIRKYVGLETIFGSTSLGARTSEFSRWVIPAMNRPGEQPRAFCVDFADDSRKHAWTVYLRRAAMRDLLALLFADEPQEAEHRCVL
jgi:hypothetical protein